MSSDFAQQIRQAIDCKDHAALNKIAAYAGVTGQERLYKQIASRHLVDAPADVIKFWSEDPCNCTGQLN